MQACGKEGKYLNPGREVKSCRKIFPNLFDARVITDFFDKYPHIAQQKFPELVGRLVRESTAISASFPSGGSINKSGYDGEVDCPAGQGNLWVPEGKSVWELGTNKDPKAKLKDDLTKRTVNPLGYNKAETVFIFVTLRSFANSKQFVQSLPDSQHWKKVRIYDVDALKIWLGECPETSLWLARFLHVLPEGIEPLSDYVKRWTALPDRKYLPPEILLTSRAKEREKLEAAYKAGSLPICQAETIDEAAAFIKAALKPDSALIVTSSEAAIALAKQKRTNKGMILVLAIREPNYGVAETLRSRGWNVLIAVGAEERGLIKGLIRLPLPLRGELAQCLRESSLDLSHDRAGKFATQAGRSISRLLRLLGGGKSSSYDWETNPDPILLAAALAGSWVVSERYQDKIILEKLAKCPWGEIEEKLSPLRTRVRLDGPFIFLEDQGQGEENWYSRIVLTSFFGQFSSSLLNMFYTVCREVFKSQNRYSSELKKGLSQTLAIFGTFFPEQKEKIRSVVRDIMEDVRVNVELWHDNNEAMAWSRNLAEAAPEEFLNFLGQGKKDELKTATHLLAILPILAWNEECFSRAANIMRLFVEAEECTSDEKESFEKVLKALFTPSHPQTQADWGKRCKLLEAWKEKYPFIFWKIISHMPPTDDKRIFVMVTPKPFWKETKDKPLTYGHIYEQYSWALEQILWLIKTDPVCEEERWIKVLPHWWLWGRNLPWTHQWHQNALSQLRAFVEQEGEKATKLRDFLYRYKALPDGAIGLPSEIMDLLPLVMPKTLERRMEWAFGHSIFD